jgi:hypothetical protein
VALAEALWRAGYDEAADEACQRVLTDRPTA